MQNVPKRPSRRVGWETALVAIVMGLSMTVLPQTSSHAEATDAFAGFSSEDFDTFPLNVLLNDAFAIEPLVGLGGTFLTPLKTQNPATATYNSPAADFFPQSWRMLNNSQSHNAVFPVKGNAPDWLKNGTYWEAPLYGVEYLRLMLSYYLYEGNGMRFGSDVAQWLGNVMNVSVIDGIVYAELSGNGIYALDARTGDAIWCRSMDQSQSSICGPPLVGVAMGQAIFERDTSGRPMVYVATGDVSFRFDEAMRFAAGESTVRGGNFNAILAFDGYTGEQIWRYDVNGQAMPTPVYRDGRLYAITGDGHLYVLDAETGTLLTKDANGNDQPFALPGLGFSSMSSPNWYAAKHGRLFIIAGTQLPDNLVAVDVTEPANPFVAWTYHLENGALTGMGDVPPTVDQKSRLVLTDSLVINTLPDGTTMQDVQIYAVDAESGALVWSRLACGDYYDNPRQGCNLEPTAFRGSVGMVHRGEFYVGVLNDGTERSYDVKKGTLNWVTELGDMAQPRGAVAYYKNKKSMLILVQGRQITTLELRTGEILNTFATPFYHTYGINSPIIVGGQLYLGSTTGLITAVPVDYVTENDGFFTPADSMAPPVELQIPRLPEYYDGEAYEAVESEQFPETWLAYAGGPTHNAVVASGLDAVDWDTALNEALPLDAPQLNEHIFGAEQASMMTALAYGAGTGVTPAKGMLYAGSGRYTMNALNARTGELIWRTRFINFIPGQPLVTEDTVIATMGDPWIGFGSMNALKDGEPFSMGGQFQALHGFDPATGVNKWTFYTRASNAMTPLYKDGTLYWIDGGGDIWSIAAATGLPAAPFTSEEGFPLQQPLNGANVHNSGTLYDNGADDPIMAAGTMTAMYGLNLKTGNVLWDAAPGSGVYATGYAGATPVADTHTGRIISTVLDNVDTEGKTCTLTAFALDAAGGDVKWTSTLGGSAPIPYGIVSSTPLLNRGVVYIYNPMAQTVYALEAEYGSIIWQTSVDDTDPGRPSWGPGVVVDDLYLIQPIGPNLYTFDIRNGGILKTVKVGGAFTLNGPTVVGRTLYIGNAWGHVTALGLDELGVPVP